VAEMRSNQVQKLSFAGLTLDGTGAVGTFSAGSGNVADATGLVSTVNFTHAQVTVNPGTSTSSSSFVDVPGSTLSSFTLSRATYVIILMTVLAFNDSAITSGAVDSIEVQALDSIDGAIANVSASGICVTKVTIVGSSTSFDQVVTDQWVSNAVIARLSAGTHTLKSQYRAVGGGNAFVDSINLAYVILGT
jgi:hypothetical protein